MTKNYIPNSLGSLVIPFNNSYELESDNLPSLSIVIPYYETPKTINECVNSVLKSINYLPQNTTIEVLVIDDGSKANAARDSIQNALKKRIRIIELSENKGRFYSRNVGLKHAKNEKVLFLDSDIVIPKELLLNHLLIQASCKKKECDCITISLFNFVLLRDFLKSKNQTSLFETTNDFRKQCKYQATWIGCEEDKEYIGREYKIFETTNDLRDWPKSGWLGPWILPNMVLGGLFSVDRQKAVSVGGCSNIFGKYGFEETSLATKLMAKYHSFVIPETKSIALHLDDENSQLTRQEKDLLFQKTHDIYFNTYLNLDINEAIKKDQKHFKENKTA